MRTRTYWPPNTRVDTQHRRTSRSKRRSNLSPRHVAVFRDNKINTSGCVSRQSRRTCRNFTLRVPRRFVKHACAKFLDTYRACSVSSNGSATRLPFHCHIGYSFTGKVQEKKTKSGSRRWKMVTLQSISNNQVGGKLQSSPSVGNSSLLCAV